jgi:hypothetical protein
MKGARGVAVAFVFLWLSLFVGMPFNTQALTNLYY